MSDLHDILKDSSHDHASAAALICQQRKLDVEAQDSKGRTLLHLAAASGNLCAAENLLAKGANPNARNKNGSTPLHMAITNGHTELARFLGAAGADPNLTNAQGKAAVYGAPEELLNELLKAPQRGRGSAPLMSPRAFGLTVAQSSRLCVNHTLRLAARCS